MRVDDPGGGDRVEQAIYGAVGFGPSDEQERGRGEGAQRHSIDAGVGGGVGNVRIGQECDDGDQRGFGGEPSAGDR